MYYRLTILLFVFFFTNNTLSAQASQPRYFPGPTHQWEHREAADLNMKASALQEAVQFAIDQENPSHRNLEIHHYQTFGKEPFGDAVGPHKERGAPTGVILRNGYIVAQWGAPERVDMTFSVSKSFLSSTIGLAFDRGLIRDVHDRVDEYMAPILEWTATTSYNKADRMGQAQLLEPFKSKHNSQISWDHLLRQTSDWEGSLWGKPDWADRPTGKASEWMSRPRVRPGSVFEYNDTRVNLLALAATNLWRRPLPQVLKDYLMDPIGATPTWRWLGYDNSWIVLDGQMMQVVSGGGHWGGGMMINAFDQARFGYLTLNRGRWKDQQILSEAWVKMALTPTPAKTTYGFMNWFLNTDQELMPSAPETAFFHLGSGTNMIYVDPENDLVIVARWIKRDAMDGLVKRVLKAIK